MARRHIVGNAVPTTLVSGINSTALSISITANTGWPTGGANGKFIMTIDRGLSSEERLYGQSRTGGAITVASTGDRGIDGTTATAHNAGATIECTFSGIDADEANQHINDTAQDHHTQYMRADGTRHDLTARHALGTVVPASVAPGTIVPDATPAIGVSTSAARADHTHGISAAAPVAIGTALAEGAGTDFARSTHVHTIGAGAINAESMVSTGLWTDLTKFSSGMKPVYNNNTAPSSPVKGQMWCDLDSSPFTIFVWDGSAWQPLMPLGSTTFDPQFTTHGLTLGTGTFTYGAYFQFGKIVVGNCGFRLGTVASGANWTGQVQFTVPVTARNLGTDTRWIGAALAYQPSTLSRFSGLGIIDAAVNPNLMRGFATAGASANWDTNSPFNWGVGGGGTGNDEFHAFFMYEAA